MGRKHVRKQVQIASESSNCINSGNNNNKNGEVDLNLGEFLRKHSVDGKPVSLRPRGLFNGGNYCYLNAVLQALLACPPLFNMLSRLSQKNTSAAPIVDGMCRFVKQFQRLKKDQAATVDYGAPFDPFWTHKILKGVSGDSFVFAGRQEDAEEFLGCLLNGLNDEILRLMTLATCDLAVNKFEVESTEEETKQIEFVRTPITNIFGGFLKSRTQRTGGYSSCTIEPFFTLQLNIKNVNTLSEALEGLLAKNQLEGFTSGETSEEVEAWQQVTLEKLPLILILHLKCFDFKLDGCRKIVKTLEFPINLEMDSKQYKLCAVVSHLGKEATYGHYTTDAFHEGYGRWLRYDDDSVNIVQEDHVLRPQGNRVPYLLFYRRVKNK